jgi:transcriptional regulator with PAS, ATPase and Fis domain
MQNLQSIKQRFGIIGRSELLERALGIASRVASTDLSVLITGESGVGKEVFSKIIHNLSQRKHNGFIAINCGAIPEGTINSELFGHDKGAFTGATADRKGYFETVNGGTIFLDEIGEMPLDTQAYLLRILESGEYIKVGSSKVLKTDVRIVAATNVNLQEKIQAGKFREDLYYRLNTIHIAVPALKERREDINLLFRKFASDFAEKYRSDVVRLDEDASRVLANYSWPGNIRELRNLAEQISVMSEHRMVDAESLREIAPQLFKHNLPMLRKSDQGDGSVADMNEREILYKLLFDMKNDLAYVKNIISDLIRKNDLKVDDIEQLRQFGLPAPNSSDFKSASTSVNLESDFKTSNPVDDFVFEETVENEPAFIIHDSTQEDDFHPSEEFEENLSIEDMERSFIIKALKKHRGKRKEAALELGISERTLYRKIKQYEIQE